ncbi:hypothetical protein D0T49_01160 [Paludibacter sp. 221]|nr:hypothetical protein [Paludibacter sp. 221]
MFFSCNKREKTGANPQFYFPTDSIPTAYQDTLLIKHINTIGYRLDTITAGDTAFFWIEVDGVFNRITNLNMTLSDNVAGELLYPDKEALDSVFLNSSDYENGTLYLDGSKSRVRFPFQYFAKKPSRNISLTMTAVSDAEEEYNTGVFVLKAPIRRPKSPQISFPKDTLFTAQNDTLRISRVSAGNYILDKANLGDTIIFEIDMNGVRHNLKELYLSVSNKELAEIILPDKEHLDALFLSSSDYGNGVFYMDGSFSKLKLPFKYYVKGESEELALTFKAVSTVDEEYNTSTLTIRTPVKPAAVAEEQ